MQHQYAVSFGVKVKRGERWVRSIKHRVVKLPISTAMSYNDLISKLKVKFEIESGTDNCMLVDSSDSEINAESYSLPRIIANKQYVGMTRLYLGVEDDGGAIECQVCYP